MQWHARSAEDTEAAGARLARSRPATEVLSVVYLVGDLGAGKTTLARGFLRACGVIGPVRSPTYTLLEAYEMPAVSIVHLDLYRLLDPQELEALGLREWARPRHVWLIEWPDRGEGRLPVADLSVTMTAGAADHEINVTAGSAFGETWLRALQVGSAR